LGHIVLVHDGPICECGAQGCFEALCSGLAIAGRMREIAEKNKNAIWWQKAEGNPDNITTSILLESAREKDLLSLELVDEIGYYIGLGCAQIANTLDPEIIILGTLVVHFGDLFLAPAKKSFLKHVFFPKEKPSQLVSAMLGERLAEMAAVSVVLKYHN
jgi:glucokinase